VDGGFIYVMTWEYTYASAMLTLTVVGANRESFAARS
jgi:hypothetical protein